MPASSDERAKMNPFSAVMDMIGIPKIDTLIPVPADLAEAIGLPTPETMFGGLSTKITSKLARGN